MKIAFHPKIWILAGAIIFCWPQFSHAAQCSAVGLVAYKKGAPSDFNCLASKTSIAPYLTPGSNDPCPKTATGALVAVVLDSDLDENQTVMGGMQRVRAGTKPTFGLYEDGPLKCLYDCTTFQLVGSVSAGASVREPPPEAPPAEPEQTPAQSANDCGNMPLYSYICMKVLAAMPGGN